MGIHIELNNPNRSYFAGQIVDGRVVINIAKSDKVKGVTILLEGRGRVHWTEQESYTVYTTQTINGRSERRPQRKTRTVHYSAEESYVSYITPLLGDGVNSMMLPEGTTTYPFHFVLPNNIPSSFMSQIGQVSYQLKGEIKRALFKFNDRTSLPFTVNGIFDLNLEAGAGMAQQCTNVKGSSFCACRKGQLSFVLNLPYRSGFVPGEAMELQAEITNSSNKNVKEVKAFLQQVTNFYARGRSKTKKKVICQINGPKVEKGEHEMWTANLNIPAVPPTRLGGMCRIIDVQYFLHFQMTISGLSSSLTGKLPVMIGTIPLRSTFGEFRPVSNYTMPDMSRSQREPQPSQGNPGMGFHFPSNPMESMPSTSNPENYLDKSSNAPAILDVNPSAPVFQDYPDLPPPSYAEAVGSEGFTWNPEESKGDQSGDGHDNPGVSGDNDEASYSSPSAPSVDEFVPNYITYNRRI